MSLNDRSPRPPTSNTRPTLAAVPCAPTRAGPTMGSTTHRTTRAVNHARGTRMFVFPPVYGTVSETIREDRRHVSSTPACGILLADQAQGREESPAEAHFP